MPDFILASGCWDPQPVVVSEAKKTRKTGNPNQWVPADAAPPPLALAFHILYPFRINDDDLNIYGKCHSVARQDSAAELTLERPVDGGPGEAGDTS